MSEPVTPERLARLEATAATVAQDIARAGRATDALAAAVADLERRTATDHPKGEPQP